MLLVLAVLATPVLIGALALAHRARSRLWDAAGALLALASVCVPAGALLVAAKCGVASTDCDSAQVPSTVLLVGLLSCAGAVALGAGGFLMALARGSRRRASG